MTTRRDNPAPDDATLLKEAEGALERAYARYSGFRVGAAVLTRDGGLYRGCNVENVSFPVGVCAERNAIAAAVLAEGPRMRIARLAVAAKQRGKIVPCSPCGACRQAILEFGTDALVLFRDSGLAPLALPARDLLPHSFIFDADGEA
jgi:cytidine deaminase